MVDEIEYSWQQSPCEETGFEIELGETAWRDVRWRPGRSAFPGILGHRSSALE